MQLSLVQMAKLIVACALACLAITPTTRLVQAGIADSRQMAIVDGMIVPLVWVLCAHVFVRRGPRRAILINALLLWAVAVPIGLFGWFVAPFLGALVIRGIIPGSIYRAPVVLGSFLLALLVPLAGWLITRIVRSIRRNRASEATNAVSA